MLPSPHWTDLSMPSAATLNTSARALSRWLLNLLGWMTWGDTTPSDGDARVLGEGLAASAVAGTLRSQVEVGAALLYNSTAYTDPLSPFGLAYLEEADTTTLVHSAGDPTDSRIDIIVATVASGTQETVTTPMHEDFGGGPTDDIDTIRAAQLTLAVVEGTPDPSPVAPATPAGYFVIAEVTVPDNVANLDTASYADQRELGPTAVQRGTHPVQFLLAEDGSPAHWAFQFEQTISGTLRTSALGWKADSYPAVFRDLAGAAGEAQGELYLCMVPGGRTWWRYASAVLGTHESIQASHTDLVVIAGPDLYRSITDTAGAGAAVVESDIYAVIEADARGLTVEDVGLDLEIPALVAGESVVATFYGRNSGGAVVTIATVTINDGDEPITGWQTSTSAVTEFLLGEGAQLWCEVAISLEQQQASSVELRQVGVLLREGTA